MIPQMGIMVTTPGAIQTFRRLEKIFASTLTRQARSSDGEAFACRPAREEKTHQPVRLGGGPSLGVWPMFPGVQRPGI